LDSIVCKCSEESIAFEVIVVDNGSSDDTSSIVRMYQKDHPGSFQLLNLERNGGTTYPRNLGIKNAVGQNICILDSDTELGPGSLQGILTLLSGRQDLGIVAPQLLLPDGSVQHSVRRFPTLWHKLIKIPRILFRIKTRNADFYHDFPFQGERQVDSAISACWFFRRELLDAVGFLDEKIFYSPEDLDYCHRVRKAGYAILYTPDFSLLHHTQQITHKKPLSRSSLSHLGGLIYYYQKHGGWLKRPTFDQ